jgi:hypothetical protein
MKKITVKTNAPYFRREQFETETFNGREIVTMKISREEFLSESFMFSLYSLGLDAIPYVRNENERKYLCVADSFYIVLEKGTKGFETEVEYFQADVKITDDEASVNIVPVVDANLTDAIYDVFVMGEISAADCFNEQNMQAADRHDSSDSFSLKHIRMVEDTDFIRLQDNQRKTAASLNDDGKLHISYNPDYLRIDTSAVIFGETEIGTVFYKRHKNVRNMVEILELKHYAHDFNGLFWAVFDVVYSYPTDADKIKATYPDFYNKECASDFIVTKQRLIEKAKELPYIKSEYKLGDGIIHIPVVMNAAEISIPIGEFHFIAGCGYGHLTGRGRGKGLLRLNDLPLLCALIESSRRFKFLYYKVKGFIISEGKHYAELQFKRQSNFIDNLDAELLNCQDLDWQSRSMDRAAITCAGYLMHRNVITPVVIDKDELGVNITED